jgi:hypothetical protein
VSDLTQQEEFSIQQFIGYAIGSDPSATVVDLINSMGLSHQEWVNIKNSVDPMLNNIQTQLIDNYFDVKK